MAPPEIFIHAGSSHGGKVSTGVCVSVYFSERYSPEPLQLRSPNLTQKCSTMSPGKPIYFGVKRSKVKVMRHKKTVPAWVFTLYEYWLHPVLTIFTQNPAFWCILDQKTCFTRVVHSDFCSILSNKNKLSDLSWIILEDHRYNVEPAHLKLCGESI